MATPATTISAAAAGGSVQQQKRAGSPPTSGDNTAAAANNVGASRFSFSADSAPSPSSSRSPAAALLHASLNQTATVQQRQPSSSSTASSTSMHVSGPTQQVAPPVVHATAAPASSASPGRSSFSSASSPLSSPSLAGSSSAIPSGGHANGTQLGSSAIFTTSLPCSAVTTPASGPSIGSSATFASSSSIYPPASSAHQNLPSSCLMSPYAARPHNSSTALPTASASRAPTASSTTNGLATAGHAAATAAQPPQRSLSSSSGSLMGQMPQPQGSAGSSAPHPPAAAAPSITSTDLGTIKHLLEAIESERLRKKRLEWYLQEVISEKEELVQAQHKKLMSGQQMDLVVAQSATPNVVVGTSSNVATKAQNAQNVLDGVDNYMFTKKRRLSFVAHSGSLGEALQPPLKKQSISLDDASIASFLSFQDDDLQALITAPSVPPQAATGATAGGQQPSAAATTTTSSSSSSSSSSSLSEITVPPLIVNSTSLTPRRPSISFTPTGSLSLQSSTGSFSLSLPGGGPPMSGSKGSLSSYSFSADPLACGWAMGYPQAETTPGQAGGGRSSFCMQQLDPRISFDWNLWTNDDQLKETLTEFFDF